MPSFSSTSKSCISHQKRQSRRPWVSILVLLLSIRGLLLTAPFSDITSSARNPREYTRRLRSPFLDIFKTPSPLISLSSFSKTIENVVSIVEICFAERTSLISIPSYVGISTRFGAQEHKKIKVILSKNSLESALNIFDSYYLQIETTFNFISISQRHHGFLKTNLLCFLYP